MCERKHYYQKNIGILNVLVGSLSALGVKGVNTNPHKLLQGHQEGLHSAEKVQLDERGQKHNRQ